ncbi:hypothetical protein FNF27_02899 [Cafeteria roenbergensis]|uniref:IPT/TIG domain-containing protein n=1 Tax=Cafeteria roenbergensis TaxID=33653 RepID=A0A5A8ED62_CAFRO|nr:hypothetical protein FNF27_02899 [Cafeteria roenbergensis]
MDVRGELSGVRHLTLDAGAAVSLGGSGGVWIDKVASASGVDGDSAENFNPAATVSNSSLCAFDRIPGCTNQLALNFSPLAEVNDGSCTFSDSFASGCAYDAALNFLPGSLDDGSCKFPDYIGLEQRFNRLNSSCADERTTLLLQNQMLLQLLEGAGSGNASCGSVASADLLAQFKALDDALQAMRADRDEALDASMLLDFQLRDARRDLALAIQLAATRATRIVGLESRTAELETALDDARSQFSFLVDESAVLQAGAPFVSSVSPASGASGVGSSVRLSGGNFASSPSASFRVVVADAASRVRLAGSMAAACSPPADSFIDCGVPSHPRGSVVLVLEYSVSGSSAGPWERAQAYFASTGAFRITGRSGFATGIKLLQAPASLVRGELLQPAPRAVLVDDFGQAVESDSSTIVRIAAFSGERGSEVATLQPVAGPPASGSAMPSLSVAARSGVVQFDGLGVAATSLAVGRQLRLVLSAETGDERSVLGTSTDFVRGYAGTAGLGGRSSLSGCGVVDARGLCCEPPLWLDSCGICSSAAAASARSCGIRIELPVRVRATGTNAAGLPSESVLAQLRAGVGAVAGFAEAATARAVVMPPLSSGGAALVGSSGASGFSADGPFVTGARMVASAVVPPPSGGWPPSGPGSRTSVEARLRSATQDSADPLLGAASGPVSSQGGALEMDSARGSVVLEGTIVCAAPCPPPGDWAAGSDCPLCAPDPEGVTSNASLLQAAWVEAVEPEAMESGKGVCNASVDAAALPVAVFGDESATESALAAAHTVVLLSTVGLALLQGVIDSSRAVWGAPPLHSGPGSAIAAALPSLAVVGMGVLDVADHGQFAVMLSQLHLTAPPVLRRSGELLVSSTGLIPGVWGVLRPSPPSDMVWGPPNASSYSNASVAQSESGLPGGGEAAWWLAFPEDPVGDSSVPSSVRALASPLGARPEDLLELGAVSLAAAEAAFALAFGFLIVTSCFLTRPDSRAGSGAGKPHSLV